MWLQYITLLLKTTTNLFCGGFLCTFREQQNLKHLIYPQLQFTLGEQLYKYLFLVYILPNNASKEFVLHDFLGIIRTAT